MRFGALDSQIQHGLGRALRRLDKGHRQLATGLRVGKAADDAAGLAVAEGLRAVVRSKRVARRNIQDGLSALTLADSGMAEIGEALHRLRELAVQGASDTLDSEQRLALQYESEELLTHISAIATGTTWEGKPLLAQRLVDVGLIIDLSASMGGELNKVKQEIANFKQTFATAGLNVSLALSVMGVDRTDGVSRLVDLGEAAFDRKLEDLATIGGSAMDPYSALLETSGVADTPGDDDPDALGWHEIATQRVLIVVSDTGRETSYTATNQTAVGDALAAEGIEVHAITHPTRVGDFSTITGTTGGSTWNIGPPTGSGIAGALSSIAASLTALPPEDPLSVQASHGSGDEARIELGVPANVTALALGIEDMDLTDAAGARDALDALDAALDTLNSSRSKVGASENRLIGALNLESQAVEDLSAAESRIRDADFAHAAADVAKAELLAQAATGIAAQLRQADEEAIRALLAG
ncbi:MAG: flagellin [Myxococcota bacterium]|nr:flagellin [Myxococcota bacterium]